MRSTILMTALMPVALAVGACGGSDQPSTTPVQDASAGTCFDSKVAARALEYPLSVRPIECSDPHQYEVVGTSKMSKNAYPTNVTTTSRDTCFSTFQTYVGPDYTYEDGLSLVTILPEEKDWKGGLRTIVCLAGPPESDSRATRTGSIKG